MWITWLAHTFPKLDQSLHTQDARNAALSETLKRTRKSSLCTGWELTSHVLQALMSPNFVEAIMWKGNSHLYRCNAMNPVCSYFNKWHLPPPHQPVCTDVNKCHLLPPPHKFVHISTNGAYSAPHLFVHILASGTSLSHLFVDISTNATSPPPPNLLFLEDFGNISLPKCSSTRKQWHAAFLDSAYLGLK